MADTKYGYAHQQKRKQWQARIDAGETVHCHHLPACLEPDTRITGRKWDLGHRDDDPTQYTGPEHRRCNRGTTRIWKQRAERTEEYAWFT